MPSSRAVRSTRVPLRLAGAGQQLAARGELAAQAQELIQPRFSSEETAVAAGSSRSSTRSNSSRAAVMTFCSGRRRMAEALSAAPAAADGSCGASARNSRPRCITRTEKSHSAPPNGRLRRSVPLRDHRAERRFPAAWLQGRARIEHGGRRGVAPLDGLAVRQKNGLGKAPRTHNRSSSSKKSPPLRHAGRGR